MSIAYKILAESWISTKGKLFDFLMTFKTKSEMMRLDDNLNGKKRSRKTHLLDYTDYQIFEDHTVDSG